MDGDGNASIDLEEYMSYWKDVMAKGKPVEQISAQLDRLLDKADFADQCGTAFQLAAKVQLDTVQSAGKAAVKIRNQNKEVNMHKA